MIHDAKVLLILLMGVVGLLFGGCRKRAVEAPAPAPVAAPEPLPRATRPVPARLPMPTVPSGAPSALAPADAAARTLPAASEPPRFDPPPAREPLWRQRARNY